QLLQQNLPEAIRTQPGVLLRPLCDQALPLLLVVEVDFVPIYDFVAGQERHGVLAVGPTTDLNLVPGLGGIAHGDPATTAVPAKGNVLPWATRSGSRVRCRGPTTLPARHRGHPCGRVERGSLQLADSRGPGRWPAASHRSGQARPSQGR